MNKIENLIALILLVLPFINAMGQITVRPIQPGLEVESLRLKKNGLMINFGSTLEEVLSNFDAPMKIEDYYFEMVEKHGKRIFYGNSETRLVIIENSFESFFITSNLIDLGFNGSFIKVGDNIDKIRFFYPEYQTYLAYSEVFQENYIAIPFQKDGVLWDMSLVISYSPDGIITEIMKHEP